ncbi:hypothetical protein PLESTB_000462000 [Pleodorina starrii]|uniref:Fe2OG dioxygenase domain-containing protein n=1 Tax=Pleodorina starrii TaxID=330485 RepID=A0A9W6BFB4_9CHLO|nr:hypothetical protein PLESTM_000796500 [Pleodorina starrii]GLC51064.1 hypothetical protein PLESTB_000462000 [Pleodorina starrii]
MGRSNGKMSAYERWINNFKVASSWIEKHDVERAVDANGGLVRIENFLPEFVAEGILATVAAVPEERWNDTSASTDYRQNNISHSFSSVKHARGLDAVVRLFSLVRPDSLNAFSAAKYCKQDHIAPHDDRAYTQVQLDNGRVIITSRTLAVIYYLTRDWREEYGGVLVDLEDPSAPAGEGRKYVPLWNSLVAFRVPRYHAVTPMTTTRPRYSIFGWFLEPGKLYELYSGKEGEEGEGGKAAKQKKRKKLEGGGQAQDQGQDHDRARSRQPRADVKGQGKAATRSAADPAAEQGQGGGMAHGAAATAAGEADPHRGVQQHHQQHHQVEVGRQVVSAGKRPRDGGCGGADGEEAGHSGRAGAEQLLPGHGGSSGGRLGEQGRRRRPVEQQRGELGGHVELAGHQCAESRGAGEGGGAGHGGAAAGGGGGLYPGLRRGALVRLPGRWQGRRKHVCVG